MSHASRLDHLRDRATMLQRSRLFFEERNVLEVDCPAISRASSVDLHIDPITVYSQGKPAGYLNPSYEYGMKRLLAQGIGDIYQLGHVFRDGEIGPLHNPEFTMTEWYRLNFSFEEMIEETLDYIRLFLGPLSAHSLSYRQTIQEFLSIDYLSQDTTALLSLAEQKELHLPPDASHWDKDTLLQLLITFLIEPHLGKDHLFVLTYYPATQAALSKTLLLPDGEKVGCRFEIYYQGIELANGYHELTDPAEQRRRFEESNRARISANKTPLPLDEHFLSALDAGMPDCCGVAVGFDRLMLLKQGQKDLKTVLPFTWENA